MKRSLLIINLIISFFLLTACSGNWINYSYYSNFAQGELEDNSYDMTGKAHVVGTADMMTVKPVVDKTVTLSGKIKHLSGDVQIVYITPEQDEVIILDSKEFKKKTFNIDTTFDLKKGQGHFEFKGKIPSFQFELHFSNISSEDIVKVNDKSEDDSISDLDNEKNYEEISSRDLEPGDLIKDISVTYPNEEDTNLLLNTNLDEKTNIKISTRVNVSGNNVKFGNLKVVYKTESGKEYTVLEHKKNDLAWGEYEWQDNFDQELTLPAGNNELIVKTAEGKNYKVNFDIKVFKVD